MNFTANEKRTILAVFDELNKLPYEKLNTMLGSITIREMKELYQKMRYEDYCKKHGITYEEMTDEDFVDAALEEEEDFWAATYETESLPSRYWEPGCEEVYELPEFEWIEDEELPFA